MWPNLKRQSSPLEYHTMTSEHLGHRDLKNSNHCDNYTKNSVKIYRHSPEAHQHGTHWESSTGKSKQWTGSLTYPYWTRIIPILAYLDCSSTLLQYSEACCKSYPCCSKQFWQNTDAESRIKMSTWYHHTNTAVHFYDLGFHPKCNMTWLCQFQVTYSAQIKSYITGFAPMLYQSE